MKIPKTTSHDDIFSINLTLYLLFCVLVPSQDIPMLPIAEDSVTEGPATEGPVTEDPVAEDNNTSDGFELDRDQLTVVMLLGTGNFGQVSKALYEASRLDVAVKSLKGNDFTSFFFRLFFIGLILSVLSVIGGFKQLFSCLKSIRKLMSCRAGKPKLFVQVVAL